MVTPELVTYIREEMARGVTSEAITQALITNGWPAQDITEAFPNVIQSPTPPPAMPTAEELRREAVHPVSSSLAGSTPESAASLEERKAAMELTYDKTIEEVNELGNEQRQIAAGAVKNLEQKKIAEIKERLQRH